MRRGAGECGEVPESAEGCGGCGRVRDLGAGCALRVAKDFDFCNQIRRSAGAAAPNIAEGFGRFTPREFARYLRIALSSLAETATHLERGRRRKYFSEEEQERAESLCRRARFMTKRLLQSKLRQIEAENNRKSRRQARS